jgi:hypothetical protein
MELYVKVKGEKSMGKGSDGRGVELLYRPF